MTGIHSVLPSLLHLGDNHGFLHVWILVILGVAANVIFYARTGFGLLVRRPLADAIEEVTGLRPRMGKVSLPVRSGSLVIDGIEIPGVGKVERVEVEMTLGALMGEEVHVPSLHLRGISLTEGAEVASEALPNTPRPAPGSDPEGGGRRFRVEYVAVGGTNGERRLAIPACPLTLPDLVRALLTAAHEPGSR